MRCASLPAILLCLATALSAVSAPEHTLVYFTSATHPTSTTYYKIYLPAGYRDAANAATTYPMAMFFVGSGEVGTKADAGNGGTFRHGPTGEIMRNGDVAIPGIGMDDMIFVTGNQPLAQGNNTDIPLAKEVYDLVCASYRVDRNRFYVTGGSMGGNGVHAFCFTHPDLVAAAAVLSAANWRNSTICNVQANYPVYATRIPLWILHGANDTQGYGITVANSTTLYNAINACAPLTFRPRYSIIAGKGHTDAWSGIYSNAGVSSWTYNSPGTDAVNGAPYGSLWNWMKSHVRGNGANTAPTIAAIANQTTAEDVAKSGVAVNVADAESAAGSLSVGAASSDATLVPQSGLVLAGSGANRTLAITPAANRSGSATITVTVSDGALSAARSFTLTVTAVNDAPTISPVGSQIAIAGSPLGPIPFTVGDIETAAGSLTVTASSSDTTLLPAAGIVLGGSGADRNLTLTPAAGRSGSATVTLRVSDGALATTRAFNVTVYQRANVALGKPATASSTYQAYAPGLAVDGIATTTASRWLSAAGSAEEWISIDLAGDFAVDSIEVLMGYGGSYPVAQFALEYDDGAGWQAVPGGSVTGNTAVQRTVVLATPIGMRRVRLRSQDADHVRIRELQVFGIPVVVPNGNG